MIALVLGAWAWWVVRDRDRARAERQAEARQAAERETRADQKEAGPRPAEEPDPGHLLPDALEIHVVAKQWVWKFQHLPGGQREVGEVHLPVGRPVQFTLRSEDVIHAFAVPALRLKADVLPGKLTTAWVTPREVGRFPFVCDQYCGAGHPQHVGTVVVVPREEYERWLQGLPPTDPPGPEPLARPGPVEGSPAFRGQQLFRQQGCVHCHAAGGPNTRAPTLEGLYGSIVPLQGGGMIQADEQYVRESILRPAAKVREGWKPIMPPYEGKLAAEELTDLVGYVRWLKTGHLAPPVEPPPPVGPPTDPSPKP